MTESTWKEYFEKTKNKPPRPLLKQAIEFVKEKNNALDLGSGAFNDVTFLLSAGFEHVVAVDKVSVANDILKNILPTKVSYVISEFKDFTFVKEQYDLVNAQYSLPFIAPEDFKGIFDSILSSLKNGGIFAGQFFGNKDEWNTQDSKLTFHTKEEAMQLLSKIKIHFFEEEEKNGITANGIAKHWHLFHFIVEK